MNIAARALARAAPLGLAKSHQLQLEKTGGRERFPGFFLGEKFQLQDGQGHPDWGAMATSNDRATILIIIRPLATHSLS